MPWPCRQVGWSSAAPSSCSGCSSPLCLLHMEERWGQHVCQLEDEFFGSLLFREGSLSPHGLWLPGRLKMPPLSHHLSQTESPVCHTHPYLAGLDIPMLCCVQTHKIFKSSGLYAGTGATFLLKVFEYLEFGVQISNILITLKPFQVLLSHRNVNFEAFPEKPDPGTLVPNKSC